jgi:hypothetical protein
LLADAVAATRSWRDQLARDDVASRAASFVSHAFGSDMARLALTHEADLLLAAAPSGVDGDGMLPEALAGLLEASPCDVALLAGSAPRSFERGIVVLFGGSDHDWAAAELGAWLAAAAGVRLQLVGVRGQLGDDGAGASRLLASASLAIQQLVGIDVDPTLADPGPGGVTAATRSAAIAIVGLSNRWRREGLGASRRALLASRSPTLLVHRGPRPGGLAPRESMTRFTWTMASGG